MCVQGKQGVITQSFAYAMSTLPLTAAELAQTNRSITVAPLPLKDFQSVQFLPSQCTSKAGQPNQNLCCCPSRSVSSELLRMGSFIAQKLMIRAS